MTRILVSLIRVYQWTVSPYFAGSCRYVPSCSEYAREAILTHGVMRGAWMAARRLARCHPLGKHGFDPVPAAKRSGAQVH